MITPSKISASPIGLDIGSRYVKACQLRSDSTLNILIPRLAANGKAFTADEAQRIADVLRRQGFAGNKIVAAVPDDMVATTSLELPPRTAEMPLDQIARAEFLRTSRLNTEAFEFSYWDLPSPARAARSSYLMGVGCLHSDSDALIDAIESADLSVARVDVAACALVNGCAGLLAAPEEITAVVDIGWESARLLVVHQGVITYMRSLDEYGMRALRASLVKRMAATDCPEAIDLLMTRIDFTPEPLGAVSRSPGLDELRNAARSHFESMWIELRTSLSYSAHQYPEAPVKRIVLCGGGASIAGLTHEVRAKLSVEAVVATPAAESALFTLAFGLASAQNVKIERSAV